jgi:hypothetical protein
MVEHVLNSIQRHRTAQNGGKEAAEEDVAREWARIVLGLENLHPHGALFQEPKTARIEPQSCMT